MFSDLFYGFAVGVYCCLIVSGVLLGLDFARRKQCSDCSAKLKKPPPPRAL
jgi:hypothetical protein